MDIKLLGREATPNAGLALHADAPGLRAFLDSRGPHGLDGRPRVAGPVDLSSAALRPRLDTDS